MCARITAHLEVTRQTLRVVRVAHTRKTGRAHQRALSSHIRAGDEHRARFAEAKRDIVWNDNAGSSPVSQAGVSDVLEVNNTAITTLPFRNKVWEACRTTRQPLQMLGKRNQHD
jgi:hypothetical protein